MTRVPVTRWDVELTPDPNRVVNRGFVPGGQVPSDQRHRAEHILDRVFALPPEDAAATLADVRTRFAHRHPDLDARFEAGFASVAQWVADPDAVSADVRQLVGAYFSHEYSIEAAALTNPSMVPAPDQSGVETGWLRVIVSLRAIGEGHISSVEFRTGAVGPAGEVVIEPPLAAVLGERTSPVFDRALFGARLDELGAGDGRVPEVLARVGQHFTLTELEAALAEVHAAPDASRVAEQTIHWLAASNYRLTFPADTALSQRVLLPAGPADSHGIEDARFVPFVDRDGTRVYYATYTAYDGSQVLPQLIETTDFVSFRMATMNGTAVRNKGMALFPRLVDGRYAALGRTDNESIFLLRSDQPRDWNESERILVPRRPWELMQLGNCGSPLETDAGWLVITHGVGPMRTYVLGAILLDLEDPAQVIGRLHDPLLVPDEDERDGYVPNVLYSCGSLIHDGWLVMAYGASDRSTRFASARVDDLLGELTSARSRAIGA